MTLEMTIGNIPTAIVNNHNEVLPYWLDFRNATLLHIDAHPDLGDLGAHYETLTKDCSDCFGISSFICPAVYHGIVSSIYWMNPHSTERKFLDFGTTLDNEDDRRKIGVKLSGTGNYYLWAMEPKWSLSGAAKKSKIITSQEINVPKNNSFILDIDLDAFCCGKFGGAVY
jgi:hypothetical protein